MQPEINHDTLSLAGKHILVTGVSRPMGIGAAIAAMLADAGASVATHGYLDYDMAMQYPDAGDPRQELQNALSRDGRRIAVLPSSDLSRPETPAMLIAQASAAIGPLDGLVLNHAYSVCTPLGEWTADDIDMHMEVNVRASMLMLQAFAAQSPEGRPAAVTLFTSGQYQGPMTKEIAYAVSKEAIIGLCRQAAAALAPRGIRVNCINPGPTDTGYLTGEAHAAVARCFPSGRWGMPADAARLVHFLHSDYAVWITGQVIASEGGYSQDLDL